MGNYIKIDLDVLRRAENALSDYSRTQERYVDQIRGEVENTHNMWRGDDSSEFLGKWNSMYSAGGILSVTKDNIDTYGSILSAAYKAYRNAQNESVEQASRISGW